MSGFYHPAQQKQSEENHEKGEPLPSIPWSQGTTMTRIKKDLANLCSEPPTGIVVEPDEHDLRNIHVLIIGPKGTPYQGGLFYFLVRCPSTYPFAPPCVRFMTTDAGRVRFNPNLYRSGRVCLSILGTWEGPKWTPAQTLASCLISIQSIMNERPYHNEPGLEKEANSGDADRYNQVIQHETLRVAVCGMMENETQICIPPTLRDAMVVQFLDQYDYLVGVAKKGRALDGTYLEDPFRENVGIFQYGSILRRLHALAECD